MNRNDLTPDDNNTGKMQQCQIIVLLSSAMRSSISRIKAQAALFMVSDNNCILVQIALLSRFALQSRPGLAHGFNRRIFGLRHRNAYAVAFLLVNVIATSYKAADLCLTLLRYHLVHAA
jgi:hypothetical protein